MMKNKLGSKKLLVTRRWIFSQSAFRLLLHQHLIQLLETLHSRSKDAAVALSGRHLAIPTIFTY